MGSDREVMVMSAVRTAIGTFGGSLSAIAPVELATLVVREAIERSGAKAEDVDLVVVGNVIHSEARDMYLSRTAAVKAGVPIAASAFNVNRLCGSGLQAIISAAQAIRLGDSTTAIAGGVECMSRAPYWLPTMRWGSRLSDTTAVDVLVGALTDPFDKVHMGITAENVAKKWNISREDQDKLAVESHRRAAKAIEQNVFADQIVPVELKSKSGPTYFKRDEGPRADSSVEGLAKLRPVFDKSGTVTAGNASSINDAAAAVVLMDGKAAASKGLKPLGKLVDYVVVGVEPAYMGIGPVCAVQNLLKRTNLKLDDIDIFGKIERTPTAVAFL